LTPDGGLVRFAKGFLQRLRVDTQAVVLASESGDCANSASSFTSELSRFFVSLLVDLILENDNTETNVTRGHQEGHASWSKRLEMAEIGQTVALTKTDETNLPDEGETEDCTDDEGGERLDDGSKSDASKTIDLLGVIAQRCSKATSAVLITVEEFNCDTCVSKLQRKRVVHAYCLASRWP
jgi:hypothetical protein